MTTRRGEPLEPERETVSDILRPLAESTVASPGGEGFSSTPSRIPDPRFKALRLWRLGMPDGYDVITPYPFNGGPPQGNEIDASLGATVRAAAACGRWEMEKVLAALLQWCDASQWDEKFLTPEEAAARALVAAVGVKEIRIEVTYGYAELKEIPLQSPFKAFFGDESRKSP